MEKSSGTSASLSDLLCREDQSFLNENQDDTEYILSMNSNPCSISEDDDEYIQSLIRRETSPDSSSYVSSAVFSQSWLNHARLDAINWILKSRAFFGFQFRTAYLSVTYFDMVLSRRTIPNGKLWAIQLLSVACLSLAAKIEENRAPALSEYLVDEYSFESSGIQQTELLVLYTLKWKMSSMITPFAYLHYFFAKFVGESWPKELVSRANEFIWVIAKDISLVDNQPSVIAAAAVLAAYDGQLTKERMEIKIGLIPSWGSQEKEHIVSCYKSVISPNLLPTHSSSTDVLENSTITSAADTKRRRIQ
ncbi:cyclin-D5-1-like isoform X1 [Cornus florida]|uniref:cyclin-D5-1-like isoform X1 n=1 Tax=Cornus florida TaxID=4283 RepID=UPI00289A1BE1|nr:cyclin-D5-1-like isoform X1 [Cornus florida]